MKKWITAPVTSETHHSIFSLASWQHRSSFSFCLSFQRWGEFQSHASILSCGYSIILNRVSPLQLSIPRWLCHVPEPPISKAPQSGVTIHLPPVSATTWSRAFPLHDKQATVHPEKKTAGWEEVSHLIQWEKVEKAQLDGLSPLFLLFSMESTGLPHLSVIRDTTPQIPSRLLQTERSPRLTEAL